jgi:hypothetical protein
VAVLARVPGRDRRRRGRGLRPPRPLAPRLVHDVEDRVDHELVRVELPL